MTNFSTTMSYHEIEELRKSGNLEGAYQMAISDLKNALEQDVVPDATSHQNEDPTNENLEDESLITLGKRALSWVLYDFLKNKTNKDDFDTFLSYFKEFVEINLDPSEKMVVNQLIWVIGKTIFEFTKEPDFDISKMEELFELTMKLNFSKQTKGYSFLFKAFHKALKDSPKYIEFASWWDLWSFIPNDYKYMAQNGGKKIMAIAEQGINRYGKHLLLALENNPDEERKKYLHEKIINFIPVVVEAIRHNIHYYKLPGFHVKLLLALGDFIGGFSMLKTYAQHHANDFWVWELMYGAYTDEPDKQIACLSKALLCHAKDEKLIRVRLLLARILIEQKFYNEAKTEIGLILRCCLQNKWDIPELVTDWGELTWYNNAKAHADNYSMYESYRQITDEMIFGSIPERKVVVENVNAGKKILNFLDADFTKGYFKYDKILKQVNDGDVLLVRIKDSGIEGRFRLLSAKKAKEQTLEGVLKQFAGEVIKSANKSFAFVDGMFIIPDLVSKCRLIDGDYITGKALISYNKKKEEWGWKVISIE